jgi:hypothetical protein
LTLRDEAFRQRLQELGYVEGQSLVIEQRFAEGKLERLPALAAELVRLDVVSDPLGTGLIASLARPGGKVTKGVSGNSRATSRSNNRPNTISSPTSPLRRPLALRCRRCCSAAPTR